MDAHRRARPLAEHVRGVGLAVAAAAGVLLVGLAVMALFVWIMT